MKLLWLSLERKKEIIETISASFFGDQFKRLNVGLNIYLMLLKNLQLSNYSLGYAKYRNLINSFQNEALLTLFKNTKQVLIFYMRQIFQGDFASLKSNDLEVALEVMNLILTYPFTICYIEFTGEGSSESNSVTIFPEAWRPWFIDLEYFRGLVQLLSIQEISGDSKLFIVKNLSKIASCKQTMIINDMVPSTVYLEFLLELPGLLVSRVNVEESIYQEEIVDLLERTIAVFGLSKLVDQAQKSEEWINSILLITKIVMMKQYKVDFF